jgi:cation transport ATPase
MDTLDTNEFKTLPYARPLALRWGVIASLAIIAMGLVFQLTGITDPTQQYSAGNMIAGLLSYAIMIAAGILTVKQYRDESLNGSISMGRAFGISMLVILIIAVIQALWTVVYMELINPDLMKEAMEAQMDKMLEDGRVTEEQLEASSGMMGFFANPWFLAGASLLGTLFIGLLLSLVVALVTKKEPEASF